MSEGIKLKPRKERGEHHGSFDVSSLIQINDEDLRQELDTFKKNRERAEKTNERLLLDLEKLVKEEEKWENELLDLDKHSKQVIEHLEDEIRRFTFDWKKDQKILQAELDQLSLRYDDLESELDEKADKEEREQEKEIIRLTEELVKLKKGDNDNLLKIGKLEAEVKVAEADFEEADKEEKRLKREIGYKNEELNKVKKETKKLKEKLDELAKAERELGREEEKKEDLEAAIERTKKALKKLDKEVEQIKSEQKTINDFKNEIEDLKTKNEKLEKEHEKLKDQNKAEKSLQKSIKTTEATNRRGGAGTARKDTAEDESNQRAREIEDLILKLDQSKKEYNLKIELIEEKISETKNEENKLLGRANRDEAEEISVLTAELKKVRDIAQSDIQEKEKELSQLENDKKSLIKDLGNTQKDLQTKFQETGDAKYSLIDLKTKLSKLLSQISLTEYDLQQAKDTEDRIVRERKDIKLQTEVVSTQLKDTQDELTKTKHELSDLQEDFKHYVRQNEAFVNDLELELFAEIRKGEENKREHFLLSKEIDHLRAYLKPAAGQKKVEENPEYMERWLEQIKEERMSEVKKLKENLAKVKPKDLNLKELQSAFQNGMNALSPTEKEELGAELGDLNSIMTDLNMPTKDRLNMFVTFVEERIQPGVVREIGRLLELQHAKQLHPLKCAAHILKLAKKDCRMEPTLKLQEVLLERLAVERYQRTKKEGRDVEYCKIIILEGGEDNEQ